MPRHHQRPSHGLEREYLLKLRPLPASLARGKAAISDIAGNRYFDFITGIGVNALGHAHPRLVKVIREQAGLLIHSSNLYYHQYQGLLAKRLSAMSGLQRCFFCNSGTEAVEGALKMAHAHGRGIHPEKYEVISLENSFHGRSFGALSITGQPKYRHDFEPLVPGVRFVPANDLAALEAAFSDRTAAIVLEMIQGEGGINPLTPEFVAKARELADRHNALLVADETQCGVGRSNPVSFPTSWSPPSPWPAASRWARSWPAKGLRPASSPACMAPPLAEERWPAAWRSSSATSWTNCCPPFSASAGTSTWC
jgi:acetylornithine/succinyldiaminopimelate/putrescine aminotransferase